MRTISACATPSVQQTAPHTTISRKSFTASSMPSPTRTSRSRLCTTSTAAALAMMRTRSVSPGESGAAPARHRTTYPTTFSGSCRNSLVQTSWRASTTTSSLLNQRAESALSDSTIPSACRTRTTARRTSLRYGIAAFTWAGAPPSPFRRIALTLVATAVAAAMATVPFLDNIIIFVLVGVIEGDARADRCYKLI
ncbi:hypothetical protein GH5_05385 [Leishmania sp. Ghana 2012 LV757]|uniref:hypothetical protein n=1 Tax=Leishmania sp. Ghana 2012 LV757 TaxID=2803181 RepID=UPI001B4BA8D7|nr:hypothetical protein GH5_05385 [Leishmania sp. Ghana 2012 LV757]